MKLSSLRWSMFSLLVLALGAGWIMYSAAPAGDTTSGRIPAPRQGFQAPDFSLPTLSEETLTLSELRGRPVLINLWATWCPPCRAEMPDLQSIYERYQEQGFLVLAVNATYQDSPASATTFVEEYGLTFPILMDASGETARQYQMRALPTSFFVDREGIIQDVVVGGPMSPALLQVRVEKLLQEGH
jgi:cytochrome c biogenesis protein CcmG/thiol:disulfide interchange protein DsbE